MTRGSQQLSVCVVVVLLLACVGGSDKEKQGDDSLLPAIEAYVATGVFGQVIDAAPPAQWARGVAQQVQLTRGRYLFYVYDSRVVGITRFDADSAVTLLREKIPDAPEPHYSRAATATFPAYSILGGVPEIGGRRYGDVLVPSLSRSVSAERRAAILRAILSREGFSDGSLYCSKTAFLANLGEGSGGNRALKKCPLGELRKGTFNSYDELY